MQNKYFIGIELPKNLQINVDLLRQEYYPYGYKNVPAHITLAGPFLLSERYKSLNKIIEQIAGRHDPFNVGVGKFGTFEDQIAVFYAGVVRSLALINLHQDLCLILQAHNIYNYPKNRNYTPHITIANRLTPEQLRDVIQDTKGITLNETFLVDHICLFSKLDGKPYQIKTRYSLDKSKYLRYHPEADLGNEWLSAQANTLNPTSV